MIIRIKLVIYPCLNKYEKKIVNKSNSKLSRLIN
jgi:hypothetical protein